MVIWNHYHYKLGQYEAARRKVETHHGISCTSHPIERLFQSHFGAAQLLDAPKVTHLSLSPAMNWIILGFADGHLGETFRELASIMDHQDYSTLMSGQCY